MNPKTLRLLKEALPPARKSRAPFAVGGGIAVNVHGYERETRDVDLFFGAETFRGDVLRAFRAMGFEIDGAMSPHLYFAFPRWSRSPRTRIDLMFSAEAVPIDAAERPVKVRRWGLSFPVVTPEHLALLKFDSDRPRDERDLEELYELGAFDPAAASELLSDLDGPGAARAFRKRLVQLRGERR